MKKLIIVFGLIVMEIFSLSAEVIKTGEYSFFSTKEQIEYTVWNDLTELEQLDLLLAILKASSETNAKIFDVKDVPEEVVKGMHMMGNCVISTVRNEELYLLYDIEIWYLLQPNGCNNHTIYIIHKQ